MPDTPARRLTVQELRERLPERLDHAAEVLAARVVCDAGGHAPRTFNPWHGTYCGCGLVVHPGDHGVPPVPRVIAPRGKFDRPT